jgi:hypothetical protein
MIRETIATRQQPFSKKPPRAPDHVSLPRKAFALPPNLYASAVSAAPITFQINGLRLLFLRRKVASAHP